MLKFIIATTALDYEFNIDTNDLDNGVRCGLAFGKTGGLVSRANAAGFDHGGLLFAAAGPGFGGAVACGYRLAFVSIYFTGGG